MEPKGDWKPTTTLILEPEGWEGESPLPYPSWVPTPA